MLRLILFLIGLSELIVKVFGGTTWLEALLSPLRRAAPGNATVHVLTTSPFLAVLFLLPVLTYEGSVRWFRFNVNAPWVLFSTSRRWRINSKVATGVAAFFGVVGFQLLCSQIASDAFAYASSPGAFMFLLSLFAIRYVTNNLPKDSEIVVADGVAAKVGVPDTENAIVAIPPGSFLVACGRFMGEIPRMVNAQRMHHKREHEADFIFKKGAPVHTVECAMFPIGAVGANVRAEVRVTNLPEEVDLEAAGLSEIPDPRAVESAVLQILRTKFTLETVATPSFQELDATVAGVFEKAGARVEWGPEEVRESVAEISGLLIKAESCKTDLRMTHAQHGNMETFRLFGGLYCVEFEPRTLGLNEELKRQMEANKDAMRKGVLGARADGRLDAEAAAKLLHELADLDIAEVVATRTVEGALEGLFGARGKSPRADEVPDSDPRDGLRDAAPAPGVSIADVLWERI